MQFCELYEWKPNGLRGHILALFLDLCVEGHILIAGCLNVSSMRFWLSEKGVLKANFEGRKRRWRLRYCRFSIKKLYVANSDPGCKLIN